MSRLLAAVLAIARREEGVSVVEYALALLLLLTVTLAAISGLGSALSACFSNMSSSL